MITIVCFVMATVLASLCLLCPQLAGNEGRLIAIALVSLGLYLMAAALMISGSIEELAAAVAESKEMKV